MDNSLKAFEVGNSHLYGPVQAQSAVSFFQSQAVSVVVTVPQRPDEVAHAPPLPLPSSAIPIHPPGNRSNRIGSLARRGLRKLRTIFGRRH